MSSATTLARLCATVALVCCACSVSPGSSTPASSRRASGFASPSGVSTVSVQASSRPVSLSKDARPLHVSYTYGGTRHTLADYLRRAQMQGFVVLDRDTIMDERYSRANADTRFQSWSVAKSFTATAVGLALEEHRVHSLDDPVTGYLPELRRSGYAGVSVRDLLRMSSGIDWHEGGDDVRMQARVARGASLTRMAKRQHRGWPPGSRFDYDSMNYFVLAWLVEKVTGVSYAKYVQTHIWQPAGMASSASIGTDGDGYGLGYCCYYATDRDLARFGLLYLRDGKAHGHQVVPRSWVDRSTTPSSSSEPSYGLGWWLGMPDGDFMAAGLGGQYVYVSPRYDVVIVQSAAQGGVRAKRMQKEAVTAFHATAVAVARSR